MSDPKPPLELHVELVYPDGSTTRWDSGSPVKDLPTGISFRTARFDGFTDAAVTLKRRIDLDYPDLALLDGLNLIGADGSVAYEGRIGLLPRSLDATAGHAITIQTQGWMGSARDEPFVEAYVDRDLSKWTDMGRQRRIDLLGGNFGKLNSPSTLTDTTGQPVVEVSFGDQWTWPWTGLAEAWWLPQAGIQIGRIYYHFVSYAPSSMNPTDPWEVAAALVVNDTGSFPGSGPILTPNLWPTPTAGYLTAAGASSPLIAAWLALQAPSASGPGVTLGTAGQTYYAHWQDLAVYGNHAVPLQGADPKGVYASDVIKDICARFCPKINPGQITPTTFVIPHLSFLNDTAPYDGFLEVNKYHRFGLEVYENRMLRFAPIDLTDYDWEVRLDDPGTTVQLQGDDAANLANGIIVHYTDLDTGRSSRLDPTGFPALSDPNPDNPANRAGIRKWTSLTISSPTTQTGALQIGGAYLAEFNQTQSPGTITVTGHIRDRAGHWQQGWKVRSGDRVAVTDFPNDRPRLVTNTDWQHDAKTLSISVDSSFKRLDAVLARFDVALSASNLTLP